MRGLSTTQLRYAWGDGVHCYSGPLTRITLHGGAVISVRPAVVPAVQAVNAIFKRHNYRCTPPDCGAMNCRPITGGTKISLHGLGIAWDINWNDNPYQPNDGSIRTDIPAAVIRDIEALTTKTGKPVIRCGRNYTGSNVDPMHFEVCCTPADLASGIKGTAAPAPVARDTVVLARLGQSNSWARWAQAFVNRTLPKGAKPIAEDGVYGPETQAAVARMQRGFRAFQVNFGKVPTAGLVRTDGVFDRRTFNLGVFFVGARQRKGQ